MITSKLRRKKHRSYLQHIIQMPINAECLRFFFNSPSFYDSQNVDVINLTSTQRPFLPNVVAKKMHINFPITTWREI